MNIDRLNSIGVIMDCNLNICLKTFLFRCTPLDEAGPNVGHDQWTPEIC